MSNLVANLEDRFSRDMAHFNLADGGLYHGDKFHFSPYPPKNFYA